MPTSGDAVTIRWSIAEYVQRVIIETATATGQSVRAVAAESFALTLWTWSGIRQAAQEASVERLGERTDLAGLIAVAFHEPAKLQQAEMRYLSAAGRLSAMLDATRSRLSGLSDRMQMAQSVHEQQRAAEPPEG
jgi:hypothetical protein